MSTSVVLGGSGYVGYHWACRLAKRRYLVAIQNLRKAVELDTLRKL